MMHADAAAMPAASESVQHGGPADAANTATGAAPSAAPCNGRAIVSVPAPANVDVEIVPAAVISVEGGQTGSNPAGADGPAADDVAATPSGMAAHPATSPALPGQGAGRMDGSAGTSRFVPPPAAAVVQAAIDAGACQIWHLSHGVLTLRAVNHDPASIGSPQPANHFQ